MGYIHSIIMGLIQGLTEFLPVSSSGHLVLTSALYKLATGQDFLKATDEEILLEIMLHIGTLIAICWYFRKDLIIIFREFFGALKTKNFKDNYMAMMPVYIAIGTFFTCLVVLIIKDWCKDLADNPVVIGVLLVITGIVLLTSEFLAKRISENNLKINIKNSILIGIAQGLAAFPGISRSGTTIATAVGLGIGRKKAAEYSFLLSIPVILLALLVHIFEMITGAENFADCEFLPILAGTLVATISGYFCIKYFLMFLNKFSLHIFAYYCFVVGIFAFVFFKFFAI